MRRTGTSHQHKQSCQKPGLSAAPWLQRPRRSSTDNDPEWVFLCPTQLLYRESRVQLSWSSSLTWSWFGAQRPQPSSSVSTSAPSCLYQAETVDGWFGFDSSGSWSCRLQLSAAVRRVQTGRSGGLGGDRFSVLPRSVTEMSLIYFPRMQMFAVKIESKCRQPEPQNVSLFSPTLPPLRHGQPVFFCGGKKNITAA